MYRSYRVVFLFSLLAVLSACSNSPIKNMSDLEKKDFGQFTQELANIGIEFSDKKFVSEKNAPLYGTNFKYDKQVHSTIDESEHLHHWGASYYLLLKGTTSDNSINWGDVNIVNLNFLVPAYTEYCSAKGGAFSKTSLKTYSFTCRKQSDNSIIFFVAFIEDLFVAKRDNPVRQMYLHVDGFEWKTPGQSYDDVSNEYILYMGIFVLKAKALKGIEVLNAANQMAAEEAQIKASASASSACSELTLIDVRQMKAPIDQNVLACLFAKATDQGEKGVQYLLGVMYAEGRGVIRDEAKGMEWLSKAAEQGEPNSQLYLFDLARSGNNVAQEQIGMVYQYGWWGKPKINSEAVKWYSKAANQGNDSALTLICSLAGNGEIAAQKALTEFAERGNESAQVYLGMMNEAGMGVPRNYAKAAKWYLRLAEKGHPDGQYKVGVMYEQGLGGKARNSAEAIKWYKKAASQGQTFAQQRLDALQ